MPNQNTFLYPPLTFRILAVAILACLFLVPKTMADTKDQEYIVLISSSTFRAVSYTHLTLPTKLEV